MSKSLHDSLKKQTKESADNKGGGFAGKSVLDLSSISSSDDLFYKTKLGKNLIDIIPFKITTKNHPTVKKGEYSYFMPMFVHQNVGGKGNSYLCLQRHFGQPCPICEEAAKLQTEGATKEELAELRPKHRMLYNVIDLLSDSKKSKVQLFEVSHFLFEKELVTLAEEDGDGEIIVFADPEEGRSISFKGREELFNGRKFVSIKGIDFEDRDDPYDEEIVEKTYSLDSFLSIPTYEEVRDAFLNAPTVDDEDEEDEKPVKKSSKKKVEEEDEEDDDEEEIEDEEEEKPVKKSSKKTEDEEDEKPVKKSSKKADDENDCPSGHIFGDDIDEYDECDDCPVYSKCRKASK